MDVSHEVSVYGLLPQQAIVYYEILHIIEYCVARYISFIDMICVLDVIYEVNMLYVSSNVGLLLRKRRMISLSTSSKQRFLMSQNLSVEMQINGC